MALPCHNLLKKLAMDQNANGTKEEIPLLRPFDYFSFISAFYFNFRGLLGQP